jgi:hypothetical protein
MSVVRTTKVIALCLIIVLLSILIWKKQKLGNVLRVARW